MFRWEERAQKAGTPHNKFIQQQGEKISKQGQHQFRRRAPCYLIP